MKYLSIIMLTFILASCWTSNKTEEITATWKTTTEINNAVSDLDIDDIEEEILEDIENTLSLEDTWSIENTNTGTTESTWSIENINDKVTKLDAKFSNPEKEVDMVIDYSLDENNLIKTINVSASNWDLSKFNDAAQAVIWKSLSWASETNISISWASLTTVAFKKTLKEVK